MNIFANFLNQYRTKGPIELPKRDLVMFAVALIREANRIEHDNTGSPGKAAIEFLLNMKYVIIENPKLQTNSKDQLLAEIDGVIKKFAMKYKVQKKGNKYIFDESLEIAIVHPEHDCCDLSSRIYAMMTELEVLKIQLARTPLQSSACLTIKDKILGLEAEIRAAKQEMLGKKYLKYYDCENDHNSLYYRSIGEKKDPKKDSIVAGTATGTAAGAAIQAQKYKKDTDFYKKRKDFQQTHKANELAKQKVEKSFSRMKNSTPDKVSPKTIEAAKEAYKTARRAQQLSSQSLKNKLDTMVKLQKGVNKNALKGGAKGALAGAAAGLAAYAVKKHLDKKNKSITNKLENYINKTRR